MKIKITIKPNSTKGPLIIPLEDNSLIVYVREIAAENKANNALIKIIADYYKVPKTSVSILKGHKSHTKLIQIGEN